MDDRNNAQLQGCGLQRRMRNVAELLYLADLCSAESQCGIQYGMRKRKRGMKNNTRPAIQNGEVNVNKSRKLIGLP